MMAVRIGLNGIVICDFCTEVGLSVWWLYPCVSFEIPECDLVSEGGWVACDGCAPFVEVGDWIGLARRVLWQMAQRRWAMPHPINVAFWVRRAWPDFAAHRRGSRERGMDAGAWRK
jgi:hypothetical protein